MSGNLPKVVVNQMSIRVTVALRLMRLVVFVFGMGFELQTCL